MFLFSLVSAEDCTRLSEKPFKQYDIITLKQTCDSCTYVNLSSISYPNSTLSYINSLMTKQGVDYNYSFSDTSTLGTYLYVVAGDKDSGFDTETFCFEVTTSGKDSNNKIPLFLLGFSILILILGFIFKSPPVGFFAGILLSMTGIYVMIYGLGDIADLYTQAFAIIILAFGLLMLFIGLMSFFDDDD
jgi:hypothetical protein